MSVSVARGLGSMGGRAGAFGIGPVGRSDDGRCHERLDAATAVSGRGAEERAGVVRSEKRVDHAAVGQREVRVPERGFCCKNPKRSVVYSA